MDRDAAATSHVPALDGLRGVAILLVILFHGVITEPPAPDQYTGIWHAAAYVGRVLRTITGAGWAGVDLFFVLSGFLITGILLDTLRTLGFFRIFYIRRALRILPVYYAVI